MPRLEDKHRTRRHWQYNMTSFVSTGMLPGGCSVRPCTDRRTRRTRSTGTRWWRAGWVWSCSGTRLPRGRTRSRWTWSLRPVCCGRGAWPEDWTFSVFRCLAMPGHGVICDYYCAVLLTSSIFAKGSFFSSIFRIIRLRFDLIRRKKKWKIRRRRIVGARTNERSETESEKARLRGRKQKKQKRKYLRVIWIVSARRHTVICL